MDRVIYIVTTETEEGVDVAGAYDNYDAALLHIQRRFDTEMHNYITGGHNINQFDDVCRPESGDYGGCICKYSGCDYWIWRIETAHIAHSCTIHEDMG